MEKTLISYLGKNNEVAHVKGKDLQKEMDKIKSLIDDILNRMKKIGDYELSEFTASFGIEAGIWVFTTKGGITFTWKKQTSN